MEYYINYKDLMFLVDISRNEAKDTLAGILKKKRDEITVADEVAASRVRRYRASSVDARYDKKSKLLLSIEGIRGGGIFRYDEQGAERCKQHQARAYSREVCNAE